MNCGVTSITTRNNQATGVLLETGEVIQAEKIISTCGIRETEELLNLNAIEDETIRTGNLVSLNRFVDLMGIHAILDGMKPLSSLINPINLITIARNRLLIWNRV